MRFPEEVGEIQRRESGLLQQRQGKRGKSTAGARLPTSSSAFLFPTSLLRLASLLACWCSIKERDQGKDRVSLLHAWRSGPAVRSRVLMLAPERFTDGKEKPRLRSCSAVLSIPASSDRSSFSLCAKGGSEIPLPHHRSGMSARKMKRMVVNKTL